MSGSPITAISEYINSVITDVENGSYMGLFVLYLMIIGFSMAVCSLLFLKYGREAGAVVLYSTVLVSGTLVAGLVLIPVMNRIYQ